MRIHPALSALIAGALSASASAQTPKVHQLAATPTTVAYGYYWSQAKPALRVNSGDIVEVETMLTNTPQGLERLGVSPEDVPQNLRDIVREDTGSLKGPGGHILTGPIYIEEADSGDVLEVRIQSITLPLAYGYNGCSGYMREFCEPRGSTLIQMDRTNMTAEVVAGITVPLRPFFGSMGVAPAADLGRVSSNPPSRHAGNLDNKELVAGTTLYIPVFVKGALFEVGDGHAAQGDGEVDQTAIETNLRGRLQLIVRKDMKLDWPRGETPTHWITMGTDTSLVVATKTAIAQMVQFLSETKGLSAKEAYQAASMAADLRITQLVDGNVGVHMMIAKSYLNAPRQAATTKAFTGFTLIDGTGRSPIANATILVRDGRILAAGPAPSIRIPRDAQVHVLSGYAIPGLVNAHGHVNAPGDLKTYAAYGVTTVYSLGGEPPAVFAARAAQDNPSLNRSRVFVAGPVLTPATPAEARARVADVANQHVDMVKIRVDDNLGTTMKLAPDVSRAVIEEAHKRGLRVATHLFYLADAKFLLASGTDLVAHSIRDTDVDQEIITALKSRNVCVSPTLMREVSAFVYESTPEWFSDSLFLAHANMVWVDERKAPARQAAMKANPAAQRYKLALVQASTNLKKLADAGVTIAMGTDTGPDGRFQGYFELMELELMAKAGLTPQQVLTAATRDAARCMRIDRDVGTLVRGKFADFVVLEADPLEDVSNVRHIKSVWISGNKVDR